MRTVEVRKGRTVESPWYRPEDAAAYVGLSRSEFDSRAKNLPHGGGKRLKLYHEKILDRWLNGELPECPFDPEVAQPTQRRRTTRMLTGELGFIHPIRGKFSPCT